MATATEELEALVNESAEIFLTLYPTEKYPEMEFAAEKWSWSLAEIARPGRAVRFALGSRRFPREFEFGLKAFLVKKKQGASKASTVVRGCVALLSAWESAGREWKTFKWSELNQALLDRVPSAAKANGWSNDTRVNYLNALSEVICWMQRNGIVDETIQLRHGLSMGAEAKDDAEARDRSEKVVSRRALEALADVYRTATEPRVRLLICAVGLLVVTGLRISELLTLRVDCLGSEGEGSSARRFVRYFQGKPGKGGLREETKRWLSPLSVEFVERILKEVLELTRPARDAAIHLERNPAAVRVWFLPDEQEWLDRKEMARACGWTVNTAKMRARELDFDTEQARNLGRADLRSNTRLYRRSYVEAYLLQERGPLSVYRTQNKIDVPLSEALFIASHNFFDHRKTSHEVLVNPVWPKTLADFLDGRQNASPLDSEFRVNSHSFRHWLNTVANKAGMSAFMITVWMQRSNFRHTRSYLHDPIDIAEMTKEDIRQRRLVLPAETRLEGLDEDALEDELSALEMGHLASTVICLLDLVHTACPKGKVCEMCKWGYYDPANKQMRMALRARRTTLTENIHRLERLTGMGIEIPQTMMLSAREHLGEIERRLAMKPNPRALPVLMGAVQ